MIQLNVKLMLRCLFQRNLNNKMKNKNIISIAKVEDADEIMKFIDNEWKKNHILAINKSFF